MTFQKKTPEEKAAAAAEREKKKSDSANVVATHTEHVDVGVLNVGESASFANETVEKLNAPEHVSYLDPEDWTVKTVPSMPLTPAALAELNVPRNTSTPDRKPALAPVLSNLVVRVKYLDPEVYSMPSYANDFAAGADLYACHNFVLQKGETKMIRVGLAIELPAGYEAQVRSRSGLAAKHGVFVLNSPGTIDSDYRGEVMALLSNFGNDVYRGKRGDRIAQLVVAPVARASFELVEELSETERGPGGFGSTGV